MFHMHTNVFDFHPDHAMFKTTYVKEDGSKLLWHDKTFITFRLILQNIIAMEDTGYLIWKNFYKFGKTLFWKGKKEAEFYTMIL